MKRTKHIWHCGECHSDLLKTRKAKGTTYLYCPKCENMKAYYNPLPLMAAAGVVSFVGGLLKKKKETPSQPETTKTTAPSYKQPRRNLYKDYIDLQIAKELSDEDK